MSIVKLNFVHLANLSTRDRQNKGKIKVSRHSHLMIPQALGAVISGIVMTGRRYPRQPLINLISKACPLKLSQK